MRIILTAGLLIFMASAFAQVHVNGYTRKDGTYVAPHERTAPNNTTLDNYSTKGNVNPYTGKPGTKDPSPYDTASSPLAPTIQPVQPIRPIQSPLPPQLGNPYALPQQPTNRF